MSRGLGDVYKRQALSLCGRLLAKVLLDGDWYSVDDRLPDFVLEYLVTDNTTSLNSLDGALAALEQCRPGYARQYRELLARGAHEWPAIFGCDELRACYLAGCESWDEDERLTDANKARLVIDAVKHQLVSVRRQALIALKEHCAEHLKYLDISWCRGLTDHSVGSLVDACEQLEVLTVWGCTQLTKTFYEGHSRDGLIVIGKCVG